MQTLIYATVICINLSHPSYSNAGAQDTMKNWHNIPMIHKCDTDVRVVPRRAKEGVDYG